MSKRGNHDAALKSQVALEASKEECTLSELAAEWGVQSPAVQRTHWPLARVRHQQPWDSLA